jgi:predicted dehydrogenase
MNKKSTVAIIGAGQIAGGYDANKSTDDTGIYTHAGAYIQDGRFALSTVCDQVAERAFSFKSRWEFERATTRLEDITHGYHDIVSVCTPDETHFEIIKSLMEHKACRTIFAEKPLARSRDEISCLQQMSNEHGIHLVIDFQRRFDKTYEQVKLLINKAGQPPLAVNALYMKGLEHNCVALIDILTYLCGAPQKAMAYNRVYNSSVREFSYEFILFFEGYNATIKTIDSSQDQYHYHILELDILLPDRRITINDNSRSMETRLIGGYAYAGVNAIDDTHSVREETGYRSALSAAVDYLYEITVKGREHTVNTPLSSLRNRVVLDAVLLSYERGEATEIGVYYE